MLQHFLKTLPFWKAYMAGHGTRDPPIAAFASLVKTMQKGTRILQVICSEAKARKDMPLTAKVAPSASFLSNLWL